MSSTLSTAMSSETYSGNRSDGEDYDHYGFQVGDPCFVSKTNGTPLLPAVIVAFFQFGFVDVKFETDGPNDEPTTVQAHELRRTPGDDDDDDD